MIFSKIPESLSLYKKVFENTLDPSLIFDKRGNVSYVNKALLKIGDYKEKEIKGKTIEFLVPEEEKERVRDIIKELIKEKCSFRDFNTYLKGKRNKKIPVALTTIPLIEEGELVAGLAVFVDISQLKGILDSLDRAKSELEERVKERTRDLEEKTKEAEKKSKELQKKTEELEETKKELEESKNILQVKVRARTKELTELNESLEKKVKERTEELQERVDELNKWQKMTIGRELKMAELKEQVDKLKKKVNSSKKNKKK